MSKLLNYIELKIKWFINNWNKIEKQTKPILGFVRLILDLFKIFDKFQ